MRPCTRQLWQLFPVLLLLLTATGARAADAKLATRLAGWKYAAEVHVRNPAPFERPNEIIDVALTIPTTRAGNLAADARVVLKDGFHDLLREVPHQIYDIRTDGAYTTCRVAFHADLAANGFQRFAVFYDNPEARPSVEPVRAKVTRDATTLTIDAATYSLQLDVASARIVSLQVRQPLVERLIEGPAGNFPLPGVLVRPASDPHRAEPLRLAAPGGAPADVITTGPVFTTVSGRRLLAAADGRPVATTDFTYLFYGRLPYFIVRTSLQFLEDVPVAGIEGAPLATRQAVLTHFLFRPVSKQLPLTEMEEIGAVLVEPSARSDIANGGDLLAGIVPGDVAWRSLVNVDSRLAVTAFDLGSQNDAVAVSYRPATRARIVDRVVFTANAPVSTTQGGTAVVHIPKGTVYTNAQAIHFSEWNNDAWRDAIDAAGRRLNTELGIEVYPVARNVPAAAAPLLHHGARGAAYRRGIR